MDKEKYKEIIKKHKPNEKKGFNLFISFLIGGLIGILGNFLVNLYSHCFNLSTATSSVLMIVTLIFFACLFTALGFFDNFVKFAKMGVIIPITGFAHSMTSAALDYKKEGLVYGFGANIFKLAGTVILYGVVSTYIFGIIRLIIFGV